MKVERISLDGELGAVNAARVSFGAWRETLDAKDLKLLAFLKKHKHKSPFFHPQICFQANEKFVLDNFSKTEIAGLEWWYDKNNEECLRYVRASLYAYENLNLARFNINPEVRYDENWLLSCSDLFKASRMPYLSFRIKAPIFVVRQFEKHIVGAAKNERSGRYVKFENEFFIPVKWRKASPSNKQGSLQDEFIEDVNFANNIGYASYETNLDNISCWYDEAIAHGICGEQARMLLPLATFTEFVWTGSLQDYARICSLRLKEDSQKETRDLVKMLYELCKEEFPSTFDTLIELHEHI